MRQNKTILRRKSKTKIPNIVFPVQISLLPKHSNSTKNITVNFQQSKSEKRILRVNSLTKFIHSIETQNKNDCFKSVPNKDFQNHFFPKTPLNQASQKSLPRFYKSRQLTKHKSLSSKIDRLVDQKQQLPLNPKALRSKKDRTYTKLQSQWIRDRSIERQKEQERLHQFDKQKIGRGYDHLGKLKKSTMPRPREFINPKQLDSALESIKPQEFYEASRKFGLAIGGQDRAGKDRKQEEILAEQPLKSSKSPKMGKKNFMKIGKGPKTKNEVRVSAVGPNIANIHDEESNLNNSFFSEVYELNTHKKVRGTIAINDEQHPVRQSENASSFEPLEEAVKNQQSQIFSCNKIYFIPSKLSYGIATIFSIQRINFKSRTNSQFIIEVVIKAYEQIVVQKIVYKSSKKAETIKKLKPIIQKQQQKQKLKSVLFAELILKRHKTKRRESVPEQMILTSQKYNILRNSSLNDWQCLSGHAIGMGMPDKNQEQQSVKSSVNSINFNKISLECYQALIEYIETFCQFQMSYLGASLKELTTNQNTTIFTQLMKKKHSQMQQTLLESLNLAEVYYFMLKLNTTYYVAKSVIISKKIKHFILYEFSNMVRHTKSCVIEEEQQMQIQHLNFRKDQKVGYLFNQLNKFFNKKQAAVQFHSSRKSKQNIPLANAFQLCFGTVKNLKSRQRQIDSQRLYRIIQSNYRNDVRWKTIEYHLSESINSSDNFFIFHNAFDYGVASINNTNSRDKVLFKSEDKFLQQRKQYMFNFQYQITKMFQIIIYIEYRTIKAIIKNQFKRQQFVLLHFIPDQDTCDILNGFLKKNYIKSIIKKTDLSFSQTYQTKPLFTMMKKKYYINVFVPILTSQQKLKSNNYQDEYIYIVLENKMTLKRHSLKMTLKQIIQQMKEYHKLYTDTRSYSKFLQLSRKFKKQIYTIPKQLFIEKIKFFISKLELLKKNTYSHFYFVPLSNLISDASLKASDVHPLQKQKVDKQWNSLLISANEKSLILGALSKLQNLIKENQKYSKSTIKPVKIKNFPVYQIYYKAMKKIFHGYYAIITIYFVPIFDLSEIKLYISKIHKSFFFTIKKNIPSNQYENLVTILVEFLKQKFFKQAIIQETQKIKTKYKQFYSKMISQAQSPFISRTRKNKQFLGPPGRQHVQKRNRRAKPAFSITQVEMQQLNEQLLSKVFQSKRKTKYLIRLSFPATSTYISEDKRKGIDESINISIFKQNSVIIYKFKTTARKLLSKKITHKYNVIQLQYQQKNKPFYILFEQIKYLIEQSDESTYGLMNTFRSYFLDKHYNSHVTHQLVTMLSCNLFSSLMTGNYFEGSSVNLAPSRKTKKQLPMPEIHSNMYQRYCLFVDRNQMLQVLKRRKQPTKLMFSTKLATEFLLPKSNYQLQPSLKTTQSIDIPVRRRQQKKQSIEAFLPSHVSWRKGQNSILNVGQDKIQQEESSHQGQTEERVVYLIDKGSETVTQVSTLDISMVSIPLVKYNKAMFKRYFRAVSCRTEPQPQEPGPLHQFYDNDDSPMQIILHNGF